MGQRRRLTDSRHSTAAQLPPTLIYHSKCVLEEAESGWFRHTGSVRGSASQADRYSPKPSFQAFEIPLRPRAEESIFKFVMETSGCNYVKRPNFPPPFFPLPSNILRSRNRHHPLSHNSIRDGWMRAISNSRELEGKRGGGEGRGGVSKASSN